MDVHDNVCKTSIDFRFARETIVHRFRPTVMTPSRKTTNSACLPNALCESPFPAEWVGKTSWKHGQLTSCRHVSVSTSLSSQDRGAWCRSLLTGSRLTILTAGGSVLGKNFKRIQAPSAQVIACVPVSIVQVRLTRHGSRIKPPSWPR